ncbi:MAG: glycosyltransferase [Oceanicaulis sp.]
MRVLLIARHAPPEASGATRRTLQWIAAAERAGAEITIASPVEPAGPHAWTPLPIGVGRGQAGSSGSVYRLLNRLRDGLVWPDPELAWVLRHGPRLADAIDAADLVITTSPPESLHVVASRLAARRAVPHLVDLRDPWLRSMHRPARRRFPRRLVERALLRRVVRRAAAVTAVHPYIAEDVELALRGAQVRVIGQAPAAPDPDFVWRFEEGRLNAVYAGGFELGSGTRRLTDFLAALAPLFATEPRLSVHHFGPLSEAEAALASDTPNLVAHGPLDLDKLAVVQRAADALVLFNAPHARFPGGKLTEYAAADKPIILLGEGPWRADPVLTRARDVSIGETGLPAVHPRLEDVEAARSDRVGQLADLIVALAGSAR